MALKTKEGWTGPLSEYLKVGDEVDGGIYDHFINVLPPVTFTRSCVQMGEAYSHDDSGRAMFYTIKNEQGKWIFKGILNRIRGSL